MKIYIYERTVTVANRYEIKAVSESGAEALLEEILENEYGSLGNYEIIDSDIALIGVKPDCKVYLSGSSLTVSTRNGSAAFDLTEIINELCAKADGGNE